MMTDAILDADTFQVFELFKSGGVDRSFCGVAIGTGGKTACGRRLVKGKCQTKAHNSQRPVLEDGHLYPWYNDTKTRVLIDLGVFRGLLMEDQNLCKAVCEGVGSEGLNLTRKVFGVFANATKEDWRMEDMIATAWTIVSQERKGKSHLYKTPGKAFPSVVDEVDAMLNDLDLNENSVQLESPLSARGIGAKLVGATLVENESHEDTGEEEEYEKLSDPVQKSLFDQASKVQSYLRETGMQLNKMEDAVSQVSSRVSHLAVSLNQRLGTDPGLCDDGGRFPDIWTAVESMKNQLLDTTDRVDYGELGLRSPDGGSTRLVPDLVPDPSDNSSTPSSFFLNVMECVGFAAEHYPNFFGSSASSAPVEESDTSSISNEVDQLRSLVESLQKELNEVKGRVDLSHVISVGGLEFRGVEDVLVFLERVDAAEKLPHSVYGLCYDMWHVMDRIAPGADQKTETDRNKDQEVKSKLKVTSSMSRLQYSQTRDVPLLFVGQRQMIGNDEKAPIKPLASRSTWTSHTVSTGRKQQGEKAFRNVSVAFTQELRQLLRKAAHIELQTFFRTMFNQSVTHLHAFYNFMDHTYETESVLVGEDEAWIFTCYVVKEIFAVLKECRTWGEDLESIDSHLERSAHVIWSLLKAMRQMTSLVAVKFTGHPEVQRVVGEHTKNSRVSKEMFDKQVTKLKEYMEKIEKVAKKK